MDLDPVVEAYWRTAELFYCHYALLHAMRLLTLVLRRIVPLALAAAVVFPATVNADSGPGSSGSGFRSAIGIGISRIGRSGRAIPVQENSIALRAKARQWSGRSRVIVEFRGTPDATVITREGGVARRKSRACAPRSQTSTTSRWRRSPTDRRDASAPGSRLRSPRSNAPARPSARPCRAGSSASPGTALALP